MMGLHPTSVKPETYEQELKLVKEWLDKRDFWAVGEIGIDLYWDQSTLKEQQLAFKTQIGWAKEKGLPIVIHCRNSFDEIFEVLESEKTTDCLEFFIVSPGTKEQAERAISFNMKLGIGGVVTFKNGKIDQFLNQIPIENIVLETDSPYLSRFLIAENEMNLLMSVWLPKNWPKFISCPNSKSLKLPKECAFCF